MKLDNIDNKTIDTASEKKHPKIKKVIPISAACMEDTPNQVELHTNFKAKWQYMARFFDRLFFIMFIFLTMIINIVFIATLL